MRYLQLRKAVPLFAVTLLAWMTGCARPRPPDAGKAVVVFVDRSQSTQADRELYAQACERILSLIQPGDRIIAGWITDRSVDDFRSHVDEELPPRLPPKTITDIELQYKKRQDAWERDVQARREDVRHKLHELLSWESTASRTKIIESLRVAGQILGSERRPRKLLILLSDMIEESDLANFTHARLDDTFIRKEISRQQKAGILPDLHGVRVFVAGADAATLERAAAIERFWKQYFEATGAVMDPGGYSRALPKFE